MQIKYRIGIMPGPWPVGSPADGRDFFWKLIDVCERTTIDSVWFSDRLSSPTPVLEPMITMAAVAARTERLKFGPSVLVAPFRSPVLAARQLAMLDYLSAGRVLPRSASASSRSASSSPPACRFGSAGAARTRRSGSCGNAGRSPR